MSLFSGFSNKKRTRKRGRKPQRSSVLQVTARRASSSPVGLPAGALLLFGGLSLLMVVYGLVLLFGWFGEVLFTGNDRFELQNLEARSDGVQPESILLEWSGVKKGENLFEIDLAEVRHRLEKHPIIKRAVVKRQLPSTLKITVNERVPIARTGQRNGNMNWLVDEEGVLIQKSFQSKNLPYIDGPRRSLTLGESIADGSVGPLLEYLRILRDMPPKKRDLLKVDVVWVGNQEFLDWRLRSGIRLKMPREGDFRTVLERASRAIYEAEQQNMGLKEFDWLPEGRNKIGAAE